MCLKTYVYAAVHSTVDFVESNYWIRSGTDLDSGQCIAEDVVVLDQAATFAEYVHTFK
jgi:hypothetical protein